MANAYNYATPLEGGNHGQGITVAVVDAWGSDIIVHDLHVMHRFQAIARQQAGTR